MVGFGYKGNTLNDQKSGESCQKIRKSPGKLKCCEQAIRVKKPVVTVTRAARRDGRIPRKVNFVEEVEVSSHSMEGIGDYGDDDKTNFTSDSGTS